MKTLDEIDASFYVLMLMFRIDEEQDYQAYYFIETELPCYVS